MDYGKVLIRYKREERKNKKEIQRKKWKKPKEKIME